MVLQSINDVVAQIHALPYGDYIFAGVIFLGAILLAFIVYYALKGFAIKIAHRSKTILDEELIMAVDKPLAYGIIAAGGYFAFLSLEVVATSFSFLADVFFIIGILIALNGVLRVIAALVKWYHTELAHRTKSDVDDRFLPIIKKVLNVFTYAIALMLILGHFGVEITPLVAGLGVSGLVIALALQETLSNFFAGTFVATEGTVHVGDYIELEGGIKGYIEEVSWRAARIRTLGGNLVVVPNSRLANSIFTNYFAPQKEMSVVIPVGVGYNDDLDKVEKVTIEVASDVLEKTEGGKKGFKPFIRYNEFGDSNINFSVILRVEEFVNRYLVTHEFMKALKKRYDKEGIEISFPARMHYFHKEEDASKLKKK